MAMTVSQPEVEEIYYTCAGRIDQHKRCRQDDLCLEHKIGIHDWSQSVNLSLLRVCLVDAWLLHTGARGLSATMKQATFYEELATGLIDNTFDTAGYRPRGGPAAGGAAAGSGSADQHPEVYGWGTHLTPTTKRRLSTTEGPSSHLAQRDWEVCKVQRSSLACSTCRKASRGGEVFFCAPRTGRGCFAIQMRETHETEL